MSHGTGEGRWKCEDDQGTAARPKYGVDCTRPPGQGQGQVRAVVLAWAWATGESFDMAQGLRYAPAAALELGAACGRPAGGRDLTEDSHAGVVTQGRPRL